MRLNFSFILGVCLTLTAGAVRAGSAQEFNAADYEEDGGSGLTLFSSPADDIHGLGFGTGLWLKNTPVFGDYMARVYYHGAERATYSGIGMTLRLMPRWTIAPYVGAGGNYNYSISRSEHDGGNTGRSGHERGDSYWSGHAEAGLRIWMPSRAQFVEAAVRQAWNDGPADYTQFFLSIGSGMLPGRSRL